MWFLGLIIGAIIGAIGGGGAGALIGGLLGGIAGDAQTRIAVDKTISDSGHGSDLSMYYYP